MIVVCECRKGSTVPRKQPDECPMHGILPETTLTVSGGCEGEVMQDHNSTITLSVSDSNHLRRLLGWVACEMAGQAPEDIINMLQDIVPKIEPICEEGKGRLMESYKKSLSVPKYIRAAIKALRKRL